MPKMKCQECESEIKKRPERVPDWLWKTWKEEWKNNNIRFGPYCEDCVKKSENKCIVCKEYTDRFSKDYRTMPEYDQTSSYRTCPRCVHLNDRTWWALYRNEDISLKELEEGTARIETKVVKE